MSGCPSEESLAAWVRSGLDGAEPALTHLDECRACRRVVAALATSWQAPTGPAADEPLGLARHAGTSLGRYVLLEPIGVGGMGAVWAAFDPQLRRQVAVKLVRSSAEASSQAQEALLREAQAMAQLSHPNVRAIHDAGVTDGQVFLVMELVAGQTLTQWLGGVRSWREVLRAFLDAGRGLAAAHRAGLVHRDFKPDNVLVSTDGVVRVTDFGLAHLGPSGPAERVGTMAFMAPEQRRGATADARSDQFSFGVALDLALRGRRPRWLRRVVERATELDPQRRYPSLEALLAELEHALSRRRSRVVLAAALGTCALGAFAGVGAYQRSRLCTGFEVGLEGVWDDGAQTAAQKAFLATGQPFAAASFERVRAGLESYARRWVAAREEACRATRIRGEQSESLLDARVACLDRRRAELAALTAVFRRADGAVIERAAEAVEALARRGTCDRPGELLGQRAPVDSAPYRKAVASLAEARALLASAQLRAAEPVVASALEAATEAGHASTLAEVQLERGLFFTQMGDYAAAGQALQDAVWTADAARAPSVRVQAWTALMKMQVEAGRLPEARASGRSAAAALDGFDGPPAHLVVALELAVAKADDVSDQPAAALERYRRAKALAGDDQRLALVAESGLANALVELGRRKEAEPILRRVVEATDALEGETHPAAATARANLADLLKAQGEFEEALALYQNALRLRTATFGSSHRAVAAVHNNVGTLLKRMGRLGQAEEHLQRALEINEALDGPSHPRVALAVTNLGNIALARGDPARAVELHRRALNIFEGQPLGPKYLVAAHINLSAAHLAQRSLDEALAEARAAVRAVPEPTHAFYPDALLALAEVLWESGRTVEAEREFGRLEQMHVGREVPPSLRLELDFARARRLARTDPARARELAQRVRSSMAAEPELRHRLRAVDRLLQGVPGSVP